MDVGVPDEAREVDKAPLVGYGLTLAKLAHKFGTYPRKLQNLGYEGKTVVNVRVGPDSKLLDVTVVESSGHHLFDEEAVRAVRKIQPLPPLPVGFRGRIHNIKIIFTFALE